MARIAAVLKATSTATWRERRSILSFGANNFVLTIIYLFHEYEMGKVFYALLAAVMLVPLSSDPLHRVPRERLDTWPLSRKERTALRFLVPWLNPITWLLAVFVVWSAALRTAASPVVVAGILAAITAVGSLLPRSSRGGLWRLVPSFPSSVGQLLRKDLRQILYTLDFWVAAVLSAIFTVARFLGADLPGEARTAFSILIVLALSTTSQNAFAMDGSSGRTRYRLLAIPGWKIMASKALAFVAIATVLTVPASILAGLAAALVAVACGLFSSVGNDSHLPRWRFASSPSARTSVLLVCSAAAVAVGVLRASSWITLGCVAAAIVSTFVNGFRFDHAAGENGL